MDIFPSSFSHCMPWTWKWKSLSCVRLCDPMDCSLPGFSIYGIFQARILEWVALSFARGSSWPRDQTRVSHISGRCFTIWATREVPDYRVCGILQAKILEWVAFPYDFSSSHVQMLELDHKAGWALKNWCFQTVVLEKTLESPLDCNKIKPVNPKRN